VAVADLLDHRLLRLGFGDPAGFGRCPLAHQEQQQPRDPWVRQQPAEEATRRCFSGRSRQRLDPCQSRQPLSTAGIPPFVRVRDPPVNPVFRRPGSVPQNRGRESDERKRSRGRGARGACGTAERARAGPATRDGRAHTVSRADAPRAARRREGGGAFDKRSARPGRSIVARCVAFARSAAIYAVCRETPLGTGTKPLHANTKPRSRRSRRCWLNVANH
jgi:hypothetical protein